MNTEFKAPRGRRFTLRLRLTMTFASLVIGCGVILIAIVYLYMRFVPTYEFQAAIPLGGSPTPGRSTPAGTTALSSVSSIDGILTNVLVASFIALAVMAAVGAALGWYFAGRTLAPLADINDAAKRAASGTLDHRIVAVGPADEITRLSDTFNTMLGSLERSFAAHRRFAANASHELRTPLATTKTMIDVALADPEADTDELRVLAERVRVMNNANIDTVDALLDLAAADEVALVRGRIIPAETIRAVARRLAPDAETAQITLSVRGESAPLNANPVLIDRAIDNLIRNAIRYNHPGGYATVLVSSDDHGTHVTVSNTGAFVNPETVHQLAEPFVRGSGRSRVTGGGHGLGLPLVTVIAQAHGGTLTLTANPDGGLTALLHLPMM
ncbi:hypothetical protein B7R21_16855 [Subtercola boreus]|uniref:histidine kinase n=1 Tax=Subtercola boreus TaxID=120213 RepID=A0A3E0VB79_9MICO|nr:HAMP domain-containing sensor histidine kinase [Subtercola boreus]RFA07126.1 hypothetical protein B7R21_16855 [Subtercola boreus]